MNSHNFVEVVLAIFAGTVLGELTVAIASGFVRAVKQRLSK